MAKIEVKSELTGTVLAIPVSIGQRVSQEDEIVILEAMKMEIPVVSTSTGVIAMVTVTAGAMVQEGEVVAVIETV